MKDIWEVIGVIDPESPEGSYRLTVYRYLEANPEKFPEYHAFKKFEMAQGRGVWIQTLVYLGAMMQEHFEANTTTAECAAQIEAITKLGREEAEKLWNRYMKATGQQVH